MFQTLKFEELCAGAVVIVAAIVISLIASTIIPTSLAIVLAFIAARHTELRRRRGIQERK